MKFWLLIFWLTADGGYQTTSKYQFDSLAKCEEARVQLAKVTKRKTNTICVSDSHYAGKKKDPGVEYD